MRSTIAASKCPSRAKPNAFLAVAAPVDGVSLLAQALGDEAADLFVVFDQEKSHGRWRRSRRSRSRAPRNDRLHRGRLYPTGASLAIADAHEVSVASDDGDLLALA